LIEVAKVISVVGEAELVTLTGSEVREAVGIATVVDVTFNVTAHPGAAISNANASRIAEALRSF
jgi:hypothetical protein